MKIGVLIPTRGDRPDFLIFALQQIEQQTRKPDFIEVVSDVPLSSKPDVTWRYRIGCDRLKAKGADIIVCWEDDDYYRPDYIERMIVGWENSNKPDLFGINSTIYYNITHQHWDLYRHGHSSMMSTLIKASAIGTFSWGDDNYSFTDMQLWTKTRLSKITMAVKEPLAVGIKHGHGLCGGGGHHWPVDKFKNADHDFIKLGTWVTPEALNFYRAMAIKPRLKISSYKMSKNPFLTIITRVMEGKRNGLFKQHDESVKALNGMDFQQIFIIDPVHVGMLNANASFQLARPHVEGEWVYLLDDDDFFKHPNFINLIKAESAKGQDVIIFKMKILTGDGDQIYPKPQSWRSREPKRAQIGGSCFVVKKWVFDKYIHHFAKHSFGDWHFITEVLKDKNVKATWLDVMMAETGKVSRGNPE